MCPYGKAQGNYIYMGVRIRPKHMVHNIIIDGPWRIGYYEWHCSQISWPIRSGRRRTRYVEQYLVQGTKSAGGALA